MSYNILRIYTYTLLILDIYFLMIVGLYFKLWNRAYCSKPVYIYEALLRPRIA